VQQTSQFFANFVAFWCIFHCSFIFVLFKISAHFTVREDILINVY